MNPLLEQFLDTAASPEMKAVFQQADIAFESVGSDTYEDLIEARLLSDNTNTDPAAVLQVAVEHLRDVLLAMGVTLVDDINAKHGFGLLTAMVDLEQWDEHEPVLAIIDQENEPEETLGELLGFVGELETEDYLIMIDSVTNSLIERIQQIHSEQGEEDPAEIGTLVKTRAKARLQRLLANTDLIDATAFNENLILGAPLNLLINMRQEEMFELTAEPMAAYLLGLALASDLSDEAVLPGARLFVDRLTHDARKMTAVDVKLSELMNKVTHAQA